MEKCYIAGKIGDLPIDVYTKLFEEAKSEVSSLGYDPITPLDFPHEHDKTWTSYMREDVREMLNCTTVYCLRNWRHSPGATIEIDIALKLGLNIVQQPMKPLR